MSEMISSKTTGVYMKLVKALNALELLGEPVGLYGDRIEGPSASVEWDQLDQIWKVRSA
jgi:hypothetical protein